MSNSSEEWEQIDGREAGWLAALFQRGNDAWCFQSLSVCVCVCTYVFLGFVITQGEDSMRAST